MEMLKSANFGRETRVQPDKRNYLTSKFVIVIKFIECHFRFLPLTRRSSKCIQKRVLFLVDIFHHFRRLSIIFIMRVHQSRSVFIMMTVPDEVCEQFWRDGFAHLPNFLNEKQIEAILEKFPLLYRGDFETGHYPDEWHWREGISKDTCTREICNGWKSDRTIAAAVLSERLGEIVCSIMNSKFAECEEQKWAGSRIGQDDVLWKPPGAGGVGFHQDSAYISRQFVPEYSNAITCWMALDDANSENGVVQYARGSHRWPAAGDLTSTTSDFHNGSSDPLANVKRLAESFNQPFDLVEYTVKRGDLLFHHQDTWHGSGPNKTTDRPRRSLVAHLIRADIVYREGEAFSETKNGPDYIYGRYKLRGSNQLRDEFFPVTYAIPGKGLTRTSWINEFAPNNLSF